MLFSLFVVFYVTIIVILFSLSLAPPPNQEQHRELCISKI